MALDDLPPGLSGGRSIEMPSMLEMMTLEFAIALDGKRVALAGIAALEPAVEPSLTLLARAVRKRPLVSVAERVIADRVRGVEGFAQILVRDLERRARRTAPDAGEAIGLELDAHRDLIRALTSRLQIGGADQVLNVVTDLVCDHVCLCEVAWRAQAPLHDDVEARIDIESLIRRAIEWTDAGGCIAAAVG